MTQAQRTKTGTPDEQKPSALVLVRCWVEAAGGHEPVVRGYIRDLRSGDEVAIAGVEAVEEHVRRLLRLPTTARSHEQIA